MNDKLLAKQQLLVEVLKTIVTLNEQKKELDRDIKYWTDKASEIQMDIDSLEDFIEKQQSQSIYDYSTADGMAGDI